MFNIKHWNDQDKNASILLNALAFPYNQRVGMSFTEISRSWYGYGSCKRTFDKPWTALYEAGTPGLVLGVCTEPWTHVLADLLTDGRIRLDDSDIAPGLSVHMVYIHQYLSSRRVNYLPDMPVATRPLKASYKTPHWLPSLVYLA